MLFDGPLDFLPIWGVFGSTAVVALLALDGGYRLGRGRRMQAPEEKESTVGAVVAASLALGGLLMAFTFSLAASRFDARRQMVVEEANAIGTTYLRAGLLPDSHVGKVRQLLATYVDVRLEVIQTQDVQLLLRRTDEIHRQLWDEAESLGRQQPNSIVIGLFIDALNATIDIHSKRVLVGLRSRIPVILWATLYLVMLPTMAGLGYQAGLCQPRRSIAVWVLILAFSSVMTLIADLDRPREGFLTVSQQPLTDLRSSMKTNP